MVLIKILDSIIKGFEEMIYMIAYFILCASRQAWSYRWLIVAIMFLGGLFFYALYIYGIKTN